MFSEERCLPLPKLIQGSGKILQVFQILAHQVFGPLQEFVRSWSIDCHG